MQITRNSLDTGAGPSGRFTGSGTRGLRSAPASAGQWREPGVTRPDS